MKQSKKGVKEPHSAAIISFLSLEEFFCIDNTFQTMLSLSVFIPYFMMAASMLLVGLVKMCVGYVGVVVVGFAYAVFVVVALTLGLTLMATGVLVEC